MKSVHPELRARGMVLILVLVCGLLLVSMVVSFQFISASDYKHVARINRAAQATALADLASDELYADLADTLYGSGATAKPWVTELLTDLAPRATGGLSGFEKTIPFDTGQLPATSDAIAQAETMVQISGIQAKVLNFRRVGDLFPENTIYKEALFSDSGPKLQAWDLAGEIHLEISVKGDGGPFDFAQTYRRGQGLSITDTTPLASDFTLFSYMPPPTEEYAIRDLQSGAEFNVRPTNAAPGHRVMVRGPLLLVPEEAPPDPDSHLAGEEPLAESYGYADSKYAGSPGSFATVPGPRTIHHVDTESAGDLGQLDEVLDDLEAEMGVRRAEEEKSAGVLKIQSKQITLNVKTYQGGLVCPAPDRIDVEFDLPNLTYPLGEVSLSVAQNWDGNSPLINSIDPEPLSYYPASAYFTAPGPPDSQSFRILEFMPSMNHAPESYPGIAQKFDLGGNSLWQGTALSEGDRVILEPVIDPARTVQENAGIFGLYKVVKHHQKTYAAMPIREFLTWLFRFLIDNWEDKDEEIPAIAAFLCSGPTKYGEIAIRNLEDPDVDIIDQFLTQLGLDENLTVFVHRFEEEAPAVPSSPGSLGSLGSAFSSREAAVLPYGSYYHEDEFWDSPAGSPKKQQMHDDLRNEKSAFGRDENGHRQTLDALITTDQSPDYSGVDSNWPEGSGAKDMAEWLTGEYSQKLLKATAGGGATDPAAAAAAIFGLAGRVVGVPSLPLGGNRRPSGAYGDFGTTQPSTVDLGPVTGEYPAGYYPPRYRDFNAIVTRTYETFEELWAVEARNNVLPLRGAVFVKRMNAPQGFQYQGRGLIICTSSATGPASIGGAVGPVGGTDMLVLIHRVDRSSIQTDAPPIRITGNFQGNVYSDTGVDMGGGTILGNLVTGLINKEKSGGLSLEYHPSIAAAATGELDKRWTIEMSGEVTSTGSN